MNRKILGLLPAALVAGLIAGSAAQAQTEYQYSMTIDPVTYNGETYAGGSISFAVPSTALPTEAFSENPQLQLQPADLSSPPVFDGLTLSSVGTAAYSLGACEGPTGPCLPVTQYLLALPVISGEPKSNTAGQLLDLWTPMIPGAPGSGQFTYADGTTGVFSGFGLLISNGCDTPSCTSYSNIVYTGGTIDVVAKAPEIDPATAVSGLTLLLGGLVVLRGRRTQN
jgi:hypothetical protein